MRANGVNERFCTGDASDWEKFEAWARTVPFTVINPLYLWTHMELRRPFGIKTLLGPETARSIYERCNARLQRADFSARGLLRRMNVRLVCTTNDPAESLWEHDQIAKEGFDVHVIPGFRADRASAIAEPVTYKDYVAQPGAAADIDINGGPGALERAGA